MHAASASEKAADGSDGLFLFAPYVSLRSQGSTFPSHFPSPRPLPPGSHRPGLCRPPHSNSRTEPLLGPVTHTYAAGHLCAVRRRECVCTRGARGAERCSVGQRRVPSARPARAAPPNCERAPFLLPPRLLCHLALLHLDGRTCPLRPSPSFAAHSERRLARASNTNTPTQSRPPGCPCHDPPATPSLPACRLRHASYQARTRAARPRRWWPRK